MATDYFDAIPAISYKGPETDDELAYRWYDKDRVVLGKRMEDHLRFAACFWHSFCWTGSDVFGGGTFNRPWHRGANDSAAAAQKRTIAFEFFRKLDIPYYCFHDVDVMAQAEGVAEKAHFMQGDIFETDFTQATVLTLFLLPELNLKLRPTILNMKPGTRVVSNTFDMSDWEPDEQVQANVNCTSYCRAMLWIVPAKVEGNWQLGSDFLSLDQQFQMVMGTYKGAKVSGKLKGDQITFQAGGQTYTGHVSGNKMEGTVGGAKWTAVKK